MDLLTLSSAVTRRVRRTGRRMAQRGRDLVLASASRALDKGSLAHLLSVRGFVPSNAAVLEHYLAHRFDLLGSGWTRVAYGAEARGVEGHRYAPEPEILPDPRGNWLAGRVNRANLASSQAAWRMVDAGYVPIDWQADFKSGFRWSERTWYRRVRFGGDVGADVKVPWELSRMQHLPEMAVAFAATGDARLPREFRNQVLDWIATNPLRHGVNWVTSMDVAIRAANWAVAFDLFRDAGATFDAAFETMLRERLVAHARHVVQNLEWSERGAANHYLANVAGLAVVAAYLPASRESDAWLAFAVQEIVSETGRQFLNDGAHFEASTCYHRLCLEMVLWATALVKGVAPARLESLASISAGAVREGPGLLPRTPSDASTSETLFPVWFSERLQRAMEFLSCSIKPDGRMMQVGDNDSGRFLRIEPTYVSMAPSEAIAQFANLAGYAEHSGDGRYWFRYDLEVRETLALGERVLGALASAEGKKLRVHDETSLDELEEQISRIEGVQRVAREIPLASTDHHLGLRLDAYPLFGLYVMQNDRLYLALRCGSVRHDGKGGHAHNDQLAMELVVDGRDLFTDPGSYIYTALPEMRNRYRSVHAHAAPSCSRCEPSSLDDGLFQLADNARAVCLHWSEAGFAGRAAIGCGEVTRVVRIARGAIEVRDYYVTPHDVTRATPGLSAGADVPFSDGHGVRRA